jgi:purine-binding chemotaxis protein CheW
MTTTQLSEVAGTYLTFQLAQEEYGVEILKVREIIGMLPITQVPGSPPSVLGVINLRGKVISVLSMRGRFGLPSAEPHPHNVIIVVEGAAKNVIGLAVDRVKEVAVFAAADCAPAPDYGLQANSEVVRGLGKGNGRVRILLDVAALVGANAN